MSATKFSNDAFYSLGASYTGIYRRTKEKKISLQYSSKIFPVHIAIDLRKFWLTSTEFQLERNLDDFSAERFLIKLKIKSENLLNPLNIKENLGKIGQSQVSLLHQMDNYTVVLKKQRFEKARFWWQGSKKGLTVHSGLHNQTEFMNI